MTDLKLGACMYRCGMQLLFNRYSEIKAKTFTKDELKSAFIKSRGVTEEEFERIYFEVAPMFCLTFNSANELIHLSFNGLNHSQIF